MAVDYLDSLKQYAASGGKDIGEFLRQHTQPTQTTPGAAVAPTAPVTTAAPVAAPAVQPASPVAPPVATAPPAPLVNPSVNVVRDAFQRQDATTPTAGAVASFPRGNPAEARNPINSRNLYPPVADEGRILGTNAAGPTVVQPATPAMASTRPAPPSSAAATAPAATNAPIVAPARPLVDSNVDDPYRFRLPSERKSGQDFITKEPISATVPPPDKNLAANTAVEDDSPPGAAPYSSGPLAMPKPTPPQKPGRSDQGAVASLPRRRNQRRMEVAPSKLFAGGALAA